MRVLHVNVFHEKVGGAEIYLHKLIEAQRARGHEIGLFAGSETRSARSAEESVVARREWDPRVLCSDPELEAAFLEFGREFRPDVLHVHNLWAFAADFALALRELRVPILQTVHDFSVLCPNSWCVRGDGTPCAGGPGAQCFQHDCQKNWPYDERQVHLARVRFELVRASLDAFVAPSHYLARLLSEQGFPDARGLPLWADAPQRELAAPGYDARRPGTIVYVGRLVPEKGVEYLVRALAPLRKRVPAARVEIVGGGPAEPALRELAAQLGLGDALVFRGKVPHAEVQQLLRSALVQALPSIWSENSPLTTYESFQAGLPIVASDIAGLPAMVRDTGAGLLARPRDAEDLARALERLLTDRAQWERCATAARAALSAFGKEAHLDALDERYRTLVARGPRSFTPPFAPDLLATLRRHYAQYARVEEWANGMHAHIRHLEERIAELEGKPPPPAPAEGDRAPLVFVLRRDSALGKAALFAKNWKRRLRS
ncbi:MAG: glycosyltransferase [Planctomycetes bacterium]|nr:glycosyltransferase [Planctomycetota bacterium]